MRSKRKVGKLTLMLNNPELQQQTPIQDPYQSYRSSGGILTQEDYELVHDITSMEEEDARQLLSDCLEQVSKERGEEFDEMEIENALEKEWFAYQKNCTARRKKKNGEVEIRKVEVSRKEAIAYYLLRCREELTNNEKLDPKTNIKPTKCISDQGLLACIFLITDRKKYHFLLENFPYIAKALKENNPSS